MLVELSLLSAMELAIGIWLATIGLFSTTGEIWKRFTFSGGFSVPLIGGS